MKLSKPRHAITTTCQFTASIGNKAKGSMKKIKAKSMEIQINNRMKKDINNAPKNATIKFVGVITDIGETKTVKTKFGMQNMTDIHINVGNTLAVKSPKWNMQ